MASGTAETSSQEERGGDSSQAAGMAPRGRLVQRLLEGAGSLPVFLQDLLTTQAVSVAGTEAAAFMIERQQEGAVGLRPIAHIRPDSSTEQVRAAAIAAFQEIVKPCVNSGKDGAVEVGPPGETGEIQFCLVTLLRTEGQVVAVSAVITRCLDLERAKQRLMSMQLVAGYFDLYTLRRTSEQAKQIAQSHQEVLQFSMSVATGEGFDGSAMALCNELATRAGAARVSLGWLKGRNIRVKALSHTEKFDKKQELITQIEKAMEECFDQEQVVEYDPDGRRSDNVSRSAAELSRHTGGNIVVSLPLRRREDIVGVVTMEFLPKQTVNPNTVAGLTIAVDLLAPQLYDRHENDRWLIVKAAKSARHVGEMAIGKKHMLAKLVIALVIATACFVTFYRPMYRVTAPFQFAAIRPWTASAPFQGQLKEIKVRPGDRVSKGQELVIFNTNELEKERNRYAAQEDEAKQAAQEAREAGKLAAAAQAESRAIQSRQQKELWDLRISRATVVAEIDGEVLKGDWMDKKNMVLQEGELLMTIADPTLLEAELQVAERDIQEVKLTLETHQAAGRPLPGELATTTFPRDKYRFEVKRIVLAGTAEEGNNIFRVYGELKEIPPGKWAPGMQGSALIEIEQRRLIWIWTHRVWDYLTLKTWGLFW